MFIRCELRDGHSVFGCPIPSGAISRTLTDADFDEGFIILNEKDFFGLKPRSFRPVIGQEVEGFDFGFDCFVLIFHTFILSDFLILSTFILR
jgi:hypothetical protein